MKQMENVSASAVGPDATQLATEKRDLLARMLGRLAHEIRNPLSSLDIHVQLLEEDLGQLDPAIGAKLTDRLEIIHGELRRLDTLVKQFLRLAGPSALDIERVDILKVIGHITDLLKPEAASRGIEIVVATGGPLPTFPGDPSQLTQALLNLVINALQATGQKGRVEVRVEHDPAHNMVAVHVQDTGPGVPADAVAMIFEPYFTTKPDGTGLGLWIAQQIAVAHKGGIVVNNAPGGGAVFTLRLPLEEKEPLRG